MNDTCHLVRVGAMAAIGRFASVDACRYARGTRVVCRTARGVELGEVLAPPDERGGPAGESDGTILRRVSVEDDLLAARLAQNRDAAFRACNAELRRRALGVTLIDVEHLHDGRTLLFYFLGPPSPALDALTQELAAAYDVEVEFRRFAETLTQGCGPGCGTESATGGGCGSCAEACAVAARCAVPRQGTRDATSSDIGGSDAHSPSPSGSDTSDLASHRAARANGDRGVA